MGRNKPTMKFNHRRNNTGKSLLSSLANDKSLLLKSMDLMLPPKAPNSIRDCTWP